MNKKEHLLVCLTEECSEVIQVTDKGLRFGTSDGYPDEDVTNAYNIVKEYIEITAVMDMLLDEGFLPQLSNDQVDEIFVAKQKRVLEFMDYARSRGTLQDDPT